jgi:hypothetical protein
MGMKLRLRLGFALGGVGRWFMRLAYWVGGVDHEQKFSAKVLTTNGQQKRD